MSDGRRPRSPSARRRWRVAAVLLAVGLLWSIDLARPPARQWTARLELAALARYRAAVSPLLARAGVRCRFVPSCSRFAEGAIRADGALLGTARALGRVARCGPWTPAGTIDPP
jgi:putative component of membrane protein insertase Oxa1/YidC/SpoIIIJ protein YidD